MEEFFTQEEPQLDLQSPTDVQDYAAPELGLASHIVTGTPPSKQTKPRSILCSWGTWPSRGNPATTRPRTITISMISRRMRSLARSDRNN